MDTPVRILYLEDEVNDVELAKALLSKARIDYQINHVSSREGFTAVLDQTSHDLILADYSLPSFDGMTALALAKDMAPGVPFILVTGQRGEEMAIASLKAGATDYILKRNRDRLVPAVLRALSEAKERGLRLQVEAERKLLAGAIEQAGEAIALTDAKGTIQYVNPAFEDVTGFQREEVLGVEAGKPGSGQHEFAFFENQWKTIRSGEVWSGRFTNRKKDGSIYEEDATIAPVWDDRGQITNYLAVKRDVTGQVDSERRLEQSQTLEVIGALAGMIAHGFNQNLQAIIGLAERAMEERPRDTAPEAPPGDGTLPVDVEVGNHGGILTCEIEPGKGTTLIIRLPVAEG